MIEREFWYLAGVMTWVHKAYMSVYTYISIWCGSLVAYTV